MKNTGIKTMPIILSLLVIFGCTNTKKPQTTPPASTPISSKACQLQTCHGLDITCGPETTRQCTTLFSLEDACLPYASCAVQNGTCKQVENPLFTQCKTCMQQCISLYANDTTGKLADCESACPPKNLDTSIAPQGTTGIDTTSPNTANSSGTHTLSENKGAQTVDEIAIEKVKTLPDVQEWLALFTGPDNTSATTGGKARIVVEGRDGAILTVHAFEELPDHIASFNFFEVNTETGEITRMFDTNGPL